MRNKSRSLELGTQYMGCASVRAPTGGVSHRELSLWSSHREDPQVQFPSAQERTHGRAYPLMFEDGS